MFRGKKNWVLVMIVLVLCAGSAQAIFVDDFEAGLGNWTAPGAVSPLSIATDFAGNIGQSMKIQQEAGGTGLYAYNLPGTIPVTPGEQITFSVDYYPTGGNGYFNILAKRADDSNIGVLWADGMSGQNAWNTYDLAVKYDGDYNPLIVPAEATKLQFNFWPWAAGATLYIDNFSVTPEPATMIMVGLGGLALIRRRRK